MFHFRRSDPAGSLLHASQARVAREGAQTWLDTPLLYAAGAPLMSILGAVTTLLAPMLLDPVAYGSFALLMVLFQNASAFDLGLSQLSDKMLATDGLIMAAKVEEFVQARWLIAMGAGAVLFPLASLVAVLDGHFTPAGAAIAIGAGLAMMIANGPVIAFRSMARIREFTLSALLLQAGLTLPRLVGLVAGGVHGCFAVLGLWFGSAALVLAPPRRLTRGQAAATGRLVRAGLPFFAFSGMWLVYMLAGRWTSSFLSDHHDFGLFAFGANLSFIAVVLLGSIAQVRYPKVIVALHRSREDGSAMFGRDIVRLACGLSLLVALGAACAGTAIEILFPAFVEAHAATIVIGASCIPLGIVAWTVPVAIAFSRAPARDSIAVFAPALAALVVGMAIGDTVNGIVGQSWACVGAAFLLAGTLSRYMARIGVLAPRECRRVLLSLVGILGAILGVCVTAGRLDPAHGAEMPDLARWTLAFEDDFDHLALWDGRTGTWEPHYPWGARTNNDELQYYIDPRPGRDAAALAPLAPFGTAEGALIIRASQISQQHRAAAGGLRYASGLLTTAKSFSLTHGYVEIRARVPAGRGLWPALWLIPLDQSWPPEIDIMEVLGDNTEQYWASLYSGNARRPTKRITKVAAPDLARDFHVYAVNWDREHVTWFLDGKAVARAPTPADMNKPMYIVVNLAVGGEWPGAPDSTTRFPAEFAIDYVRAYTPPPGTPHDKETGR